MFAHDDVAHAVDDAGVHQHEPISLEVDARFGAQLDHRGDLPRERPAEREAESGASSRDGTATCGTGASVPRRPERWIVQRFFELAVEHERERVKLARDEERQARWSGRPPRVPSRPRAPARIRAVDTPRRKCRGARRHRSRTSRRSQSSRCRPCNPLRPHWRRKPGLTRFARSTVDVCLVSC